MMALALAMALTRGRVNLEGIGRHHASVAAVNLPEPNAFIRKRDKLDHGL